jgi:hypothetical protein
MSPIRGLELNDSAHCALSRVHGQGRRTPHRAKQFLDEGKTLARAQAGGRFRFHRTRQGLTPQMVLSDPAADRVTRMTRLHQAYQLMTSLVRMVWPADWASGAGRAPKLALNRHLDHGPRCVSDWGRPWLLLWRSLTIALVTLPEPWLGGGLGHALAVTNSSTLILQRCWIAARGSHRRRSCRGSLDHAEAS